MGTCVIHIAMDNNRQICEFNSVMVTDTETKNLENFEC